MATEVEPSLLAQTVAATDVVDGSPFGADAEKETFTKVYNQWLGHRDNHSSFLSIPRFHADTAPTTQLQLKTRELSRDLHYQRKVHEAVENSELETLWKILEVGSGTPAEPSDLSGVSPTGPADAAAAAPEGWLDYHQLLDCRRKVAEWCPRFTHFFRPHVILSLHRNEQGKVSINTLFDLVMRQVSIWQLRLGLGSYDTYGRGELTENDMQEYILEQIRLMPQLEKLDEDFFETYVVYAARKFFFFLDKHRLRRIKIKDLLLSAVTSEFNELQEEYIPPRYEKTNWFSVPYVTRVHGMYISLDTDQNGLLSQQEFQQYGAGTLSSMLVKRLFQTCPTYNGEIDYKAYLDFVLAKENPQTPQSIRYFARLLDVDSDGRITRQTVARFWSAIGCHPLMAQTEPPETADITNEIFDMVRPADLLHITVNELVSSGYGHTVCSILTDVDGFWAYEARENQAGPEITEVAEVAEDTEVTDAPHEPGHPHDQR